MIQSEITEAVLKMNRLPSQPTPKKSQGLEFDVLKTDFDRKFIELEKYLKHNHSNVDQLSLDIQTVLASLRSKQDALTAKVDSMDLAYDKRIANMEATLAPLLQSYDSFHQRMTPAKVVETINKEIHEKMPQIVDQMWTDKFEISVKQLIATDSSELKAMVRQDLQRLEAILASSFEHNRSQFTAGDHEGVEVSNRRSFSEIPSLR